MIDPSEESESAILSTVNQANIRIDFDLRLIKRPIDRYIIALRIMGFPHKQIYENCQKIFESSHKSKNTYVRDRIGAICKKYPALTLELRNAGILKESTRS